MTRPRILLLAATLAAGPPAGVDGPPTVVRGADPSQFELVGIGPDSIEIVDGEIRLPGNPLGYFATRNQYEDYIRSYAVVALRPSSVGQALLLR